MNQIQAFLVMQRDFFYTDEVMAPVFDPQVCSNPRQIFFDQTAAQDHALHCSWQSLTLHSLGDWAVGLDSLTSLPPRVFYRDGRKAAGSGYRDISPLAHRGRWSFA